MGTSTEGRSGSFQNLKQREGEGVERIKQSAELPLLRWDEEKGSDSKKLAWSGP